MTAPSAAPATTRRPRTVLRTLAATLVSLSLALAGATLVLGCNGGTADHGGATDSDGGAGATAMATHAAMPSHDAATHAAMTGDAAILAHDHGMSSAQMDELWSARPAFVMDNGARVSEAYAFALAEPGPLEYMPCYCGCVAMDHRSNLDCFFKPRTDPNDPLTFEEHASFCGICVDTALLAKHRLAEGRTLAEIRAEVDATFPVDNVPGTDTALPPTA